MPLDNGVQALATRIRDEFNKTRRVASIAALRTASVPVLGTYAIVASYYSGQRDPGGGTFFWDSSSTDADDGGMTIQITGQTTGRWKRLVLDKSQIEASWFGVRSTIFGGSSASGSANATALNAAISYLFGIGGGVLLLPPGIIWTSTITMRSFVYLRGHIEGTTLKLANGVNNHIIAWVSNAQIQKTGIQDLCIDGNKASNSSGNALHIYQDVFGTTNFRDTEMILSNLRIEEVAGNGIFIDGAGTQTNPATGQPLYYLVRVIMFDRVVVGYCNLKGLNASKLTDSNFVNGCVFKGCQQQGMYFNLCSNLNLTNAKAFWCCQGTGNDQGGIHFLNCQRTTLVGCEVQEDFKNGFFFDTCSDFILDGCRADANSPSLTPDTSTATGNGFEFNGCSYFIGTLSANSFPQARAKQSRGMYVNSAGLSFSSLALISQLQQNGNYLNDSEANSGNSWFTVNGIPTFRQFVVRAANTRTEFTETDGGAGGDALCDIDIYTQASTNQAQFRYFRRTNAATAQIIFCRGNASSQSTLLIDAGKGQIRFFGNTLANTTPASSAGAGSLTYITNGRNTGETAGNGTGCFARSDGTNWRTLYDNSVVQV